MYQYGVIARLKTVAWITLRTLPFLKLSSSSAVALKSCLAIASISNGLNNCLRITDDEEFFLAETSWWEGISFSRLGRIWALRPSSHRTISQIQTDQPGGNAIFFSFQVSLHFRKQKAELHFPRNVNNIDYQLTFHNCVWLIWHTDTSSQGATRRTSLRQPCSFRQVSSPIIRQSLNYSYPMCLEC